MLNRYTLSALGVLIVLAAFLLLHTNEEERILQRLEQLRALTEISSPESGVGQLTRASQIGQYFSEQTVFDLTRAGHGTIIIDGRDELVRRIIRGRARLGQIKGEQDRFLEIHTVAVRLQKKADDWVITGATHLRDERQSSPGGAD